MKKIKIIAFCLILAIFTLTSSGCALIAPAISAGISYAIYKATKK